MIGIYLIRNLVDSKVYVGRSKNINRRFIKHKSNLRKQVHGNNHLQNAWNKYGENSFSFEIICECDITELVEKEGFYIEKFNSMEREFGYNLNKETQGGLVFSKETREKLSKARKGRKMSEETKRKIGESNRKRVTGTKLSEETKKKISDSLKGRKRTKEYCEKLSKAKAGRTVSEETKRKISETLKRKMEDEEYKAKQVAKLKESVSRPETREKMSKAKVGKKLSEEHKQKLSEASKIAWEKRRR